VGLPGVVFTGPLIYSVAARAAQRLNRRAVLVAGAGAAVLKAHLPPTIVAVEWVSYPALFSRAAAVVHQGGVGTTAQALRAGVPQLVMPFAHDQFDNADRVRRLGCGQTIGRARLSARSLVRALEALLANAEIAATACQEAALMREERGAARAAEALLGRFSR
jgi:UDP:flavonoid glycosyltransferase YjiC (YdhE family)